jgi:AcrR family transcriptional regulator
MASEEKQFQRARRPEHKQQRYDAIITAARALAVRDSVRAISLADIAAEVGMHKSALLRYFTTRDEIYLVIAEEEWENWATAARDALAGARPGSSADVAEAFASTLVARPLLCDLLAHVPLNLERNVPLDSVRRYKVHIIALVMEVLGAVNTVLPTLTETDLIDLMLTVSAVAASLHQIAHPPPTLAALYRDDPSLGHAALEFVPILRRVTETFLKGLQD